MNNVDRLIFSVFSVMREKESDGLREGVRYIENIYGKYIIYHSDANVTYLHKVFLL